MNEKQIKQQLKYVLSGLELDKDRKDLLYNIYLTLLEAAINGENPDMSNYLTKDNIPAATEAKLGGIKSQKTGTTSGKDYKVEVDSDGTAKVNVPWTDTNTTYSKATASTDGLMAKEDKSKLDGLILVPTGGSTGQVLKKTASGVAWQNDTNTTYSAANASTLGLVKQAATIAALEGTEELTEVIGTLNTLISNLKTAGIIANS